MLSSLVYLLNILSNAYRQTNFVLQEELSITLSDQTRFAVKRKTRGLRVYTETQNVWYSWNLNESSNVEHFLLLYFRIRAITSAIWMVRC